MAHLNLLPWRAELKKERETRFVLISMIALSITGTAFFGVYSYIEGLISWQKQRNAYIQTEIEKADKKIAEIKELDTQRDQLFARMDVIQKLQGNRHQIVHMFDEIVNTAPGDLYYESLVQNGDTITLVGVAKSNALVSEVMNNIEASPWFQKPDLKIIQKRLSRFYKTGDMNRKVSEFRFSVKQGSPKKDTDENEM